MPQVGQGFPRKSARLPQTCVYPPHAAKALSKMSNFLDNLLADQIKPGMSAISNKETYQILPDIDHIGIINDQKALKRISAF